MDWEREEEGDPTRTTGEEGRVHMEGSGEGQEQSVTWGGGNPSDPQAPVGEMSVDGDREAVYTLDRSRKRHI